MKSEFVMAINQICSERNLPQEIILEAIESALVSAYKRNFGSGQNVRAAIDVRTGEPHVFLERIAVETVEDDRFEVSLRDATKIDAQAELGTLIQTDVTPKSFGRIAAQTAKQVILQRIREAERDALFSSYIDREGELINGMIANITAQAVTLNLGRTEAIMPRSQQVPRERYRIGQRVRAYVMEVRKTSRGPQIVVSRTHRHMLRRLLELEVPEIFNGTVEIKGIAREAGSRSKVAVAALQAGVDAVGSCVGIRGMRIQSIVNELGGEKIDVVEWSSDTSTFIANALSPAKVSYTLLEDQGNDNKTATVVVPDDQLSLAIGKEGQNARLAAKLTGWRIDIKSRSEAEKEDVRKDGIARPAASKQKDILAMAEAILLGKEAPLSVADQEQQEEAIPELELEEVAQAAEAMADEAELELSVAGQEDAVSDWAPETDASVPEPEVLEEAITEPAAQIEALPEEPETLVIAAPLEEQETEIQAEVPVEIQVLQPATPEPAKAQERQEKGKAERQQMTYEYVEDEELNLLKTPEKKAQQRKRRQLELDEKTGQVVSRRKHKREDRVGPIDWVEEDY